MAYLNHNKLFIPSDERDENVWADYIELLCVLRDDKVIYLDYVYDCIRDDDKKIVQKLSTLEEYNGENVGIKGIFNSMDAFDEAIESQSKLEDKLRRIAIDNFEFTKLRLELFGEDYPFIVSENHILLKENLTSKQKIYIVLVVSSLLRSITKAGMFDLSHKFEKLCEPVFRRLLPSTSYVEFIGAGGDNDETLSQLFYDKIDRISKRIFSELNSKFTRESAGKHNVGDGGLDWWGVNEFPDKEDSRQVYFAQCACGRNWIDKQFDTNQSKWRNYIQFKAYPTTIHFIPRSYRTFYKAWYNTLDVFDVVLVDRFRLLHLITENEASNIVISYSDLFEELLGAELDYFD